MNLWVQLGVAAVYFVVVLGIGAVAYRRTSATPTDYFLGGRTARSVVLFMALMGTNITPFLLMGIPGLSYRAGIGVFGYTAAFPALAIPLTLYLIGYPAWIAARELDAVTPAELYARRMASPLLGRLMFLVFFVYTLPYMVTGVVGVGLAVDVFSGQAISFEVAAAGILAITLAYTSLGGMRATMWTNVFQGTIFSVFMVVACIGVVSDGGGLTSLMGQLETRYPELLSTPDHPPFIPGMWGSWALAMGLTVIAFPHILVRIFAARDGASLKNSIRYYPITMIGLMLVATLFGVWGKLEFPDFVGQEPDRIFPLLIQSHFGSVMQGIALASILAAVMSSLDAQMLTLSSMLTRDVWGGLSHRGQVILGRVFMVVLALATYLFVLQRPASIFDLAGFSFSGYLTLVPTLFLALHWRRFTATGAIASIVGGNLVWILSYQGFIPGLGLLPVAWGFGTAILVGVAVSWFTVPPDMALTERILGPIEQAMNNRSTNHQPPLEGTYGQENQS